MYSLIPRFLRKRKPQHRADKPAKAEKPNNPDKVDTVDTGGKAFSERGATSVLVALMIPVLFGAAALALDFGKMVYERQVLGSAMDAAALAGSYALPSDPVAARTAALEYAHANDPDSHPTVSFWCVVASTGDSKTVAAGQVPGVCNPGTTAGAKCSTSICAIPCTPGSGRLCNTLTVSDDKEVSFSFAPVIGIKTGNTGDISATACKGGCGAQSPNPMDVVLVADRTGSMSGTDRNLMIKGIKNTLQTMTKEQQYVALGTIHRSSASPGSCITTASKYGTSGPWVPVPFSNNYTKKPAKAGATPPLNEGSTLVKGVNCLPESSGHGTYLASPMKAAARYVLDSKNVAGLPARSKEVPVRKGIIFETDGQPNEDYISGSTSLNSGGDVGSTDGKTACNNLKSVAANAKKEGILIVTVAFGDATRNRCGNSSTELVRDVLAAAASPDAEGKASKSESSCNSAAARAVENNDGDFFFCAANGDELGPIFASAINAISPNTQLMRIPD